MGRLILCHTKKAERPYFVKAMNLNLYTLEELCYFLYDNLSWIDETIVNDELSDWIIRELQLIELKDSLESSRGSIKNFIMLILKYADYVSKDDMEDANRLLGQLGEQSDFDKTLGRALHFLQCKLYVEAILEYKKLTESSEKNQLEKIYNNMGVAYAGLFQYKEAAKCFQKAYSENKDPIIYKHFIYAVSMLAKEDTKDFQDELQQEDVSVYHSDMQKALKEQENKKLNQLNEVLHYKDDGQIAKYYKGLDCLLNDWKKEYIKFTS